VGLIYVDSCLLVYAFEQHPVFGPAVLAAMAREAPDRLAISAMTKMECLVKPMRIANLVLQRHYERGFGAFHLLAMPESVFLLAAQLRARFGLKTPDALHLACAQHYRCDALWTNDDRLAQAGHGLARNILQS
jgi:uncharacterized protein